MHLPVLNNSSNKSLGYNRILSLDLIRCFAIFAVILVHATEHVYKMNANFFHNISLTSGLFAHTTFTIGRLGVPFFLFLTGYLLLGKYFDDNACKDFWRNNWLRLVVTTEVWIVIYNVFLTVVKEKPWSFVKMIEEMLFLHLDITWEHMWYMPKIIGLYVFLPVLSRALFNLDIKVLKFPMFLFGFYLTFVPIIQVILNVNVYYVLDPGFIGGLYGFYILLGFLIRKDIGKQLTNYNLLFGALISFAFTVFLQCFSFSRNVGYTVWYNCGSLMMCAFLIFILLVRSCENMEMKQYLQGFLSNISQLAFSIYLIHFPILLMIEGKITIINLGLPVQVVILWLATSVISVFCTVFMSQFALFRKYLLFIKTDSWCR